MRGQPQYQRTVRGRETPVATQAGRGGLEEGRAPGEEGQGSGAASQQLEWTNSPSDSMTEY